MEKPPQFIKEFSKEESPEERQQAAQAIRAKRAEHFTEKSSQTERQGELQQVTSEREQALVEQLEAVGKLENKIAELSTSGLGKILNYFQLRKLRVDIVGGQKTYDELKQQQDTEITEQQGISQKLESEETPPALQEAKAMLGNFYKGQKEKWANSEYMKEDITKYFSEENLASLSPEDYALLLKRFPREMVAHVTRQGIRDHIGMIYHSAGEGAYVDGFMKMVEDGRLRSPLGVYLVEGEKEQAIAKFLHLESFKSKEEALNHLATLTDARQGEAGSYADRMAVHFATEEVADTYYGSEKGNEIFVAYPSAYIVSQYYFSGQLNESGGGYWNDQWVWANEERGMDLNAGLVFIPEEAKVDKKTGSRYELDESRNPVKNSEYQTAFRKVADSADFHNFANQVMEITGKLNQHWDEPNLLPKNRELLEKLEPFRQRLEQEFGITDQRLQHAILDYHNLFSLDIQKKNQEEGREDSFSSVDSVIEGAIKQEGILFSEAKDTTSSKEFWEARFAENPTKRPSKIVYYKGADPTSALWQWRKEHGIGKKAGDKDVGFSERHVERSAPQAIAGLDRFKTLSEKVIEDYFAQKEVSI
jgi:hypothetical protein